MKIKAKLKGKTKTLTPEQKANILDHLKIMNANPEYQEKRLKQLKILHFSQEHKEHLKKLQLMHSKRVSVLDTSSNETITYSTLNEAAQSIGCSRTTIRAALKNLQEIGVYTLIQKRFIPITENLIGEDTTKIIANLKPLQKRGKAKKIEVLDTINKKTLNFSSASEAARWVGCNYVTILHALKVLKEKGIHQPIKKRYQVKYIKD